MAVHEYVSEDRIRTDVEATGEFGAVPGPGRGRTALPGTEPNRRAREYLVERLEDAGMDVRVDAVGNVAGRWVSGEADPKAAPVASGSHLDSVREGGIFDGVLGVYAGLESVRAMQDAGFEPERPVEVVSFTEEEGSRFSDGVLGSSVAIGAESTEAALARTDADGTSLETALSEIGFRGEGRLDATAWDAWLELHVEQSGRLETAGVPVGVVTAITGTTRCHVGIEGEADHAGTTAMGDRTDALAAASEFVLDVEAAAEEVVATDSETAVGTVGKFDVAPNAVNVVPGRVDLEVDVRDVESDSMDRIVDAGRQSLRRLEAERDVETSLECPYRIEPIPMADRCQRALREGASRAELRTLDLHSGAGHDTMQVGRVTDAGMVFAPSRDGASHSPREWTDWTDCAAATRAVAEGIATLSGA